jgi:serine/threonine protein kinase
MTPESIGGYQIIKEIGRGAMGVVYHAHDKGIDRPVAIKVIRVDPGTTAEAGAQLRQRLIREASMAGKISHPGIVTVYQLGEDGDNVFVAMEYVEGSSLELLLTNNPLLDRGWSLDILRQIADALDYAHKSKVVHRDIKPANVLVRGDGRVKVADFGIAKMTADASSGLTGTGMSIGSPAYMSPEQVQGAPIDGRSDQFALGAIAFQMLSGRLPFHGDTAHTLMYRIVTADPFEALPGDVPLTPGVRAALARGLAKDPANRFPDCGSFIRELAAAAGVEGLNSQTSTVKMLAATVPLPAIQSKNRMLLPAAGVLLLVLLGGGIYWYSHGANSPAQSSSAQTRLIKAITDGTNEEVNSLLSPETVNAVNPDGMTPLLTAVTYGKVDAVKALLAKGANVNKANHEGSTPLMVASEGTAYLPNNLPLVESLLAANPNLEAQDSRGRTALHRATAEGKLDVVRLLLDHKADIDQKTYDGATPLYYSVEFGKLPVLQFLIERHAQVDLSDSSGNTPLMVAAEGNAYLQNNAPMVEALLAAGSRVDSVDARGRSALYRASGEGKEDAMRLLLDHQANANLRSNDQSTPLIAAVTYAKLGAALLLLERGANVDLGDSGDTTPLMIAAETSAYIKDPADFIKLLLEHGAKRGIKDSRGRTALQRAMETKNVAAVELLK